MIPAYAPIILFVYNRPTHTAKTLEALKHNEIANKSILHVFADGPKKDATEETLTKISKVRDVVSQINGFAEVHLHFSETNKGCARSVREGITEVIDKYGSAIIVEDDIEATPYFLSYLNQALQVYEGQKNIWTIGAYGVDIKLPDRYIDNHDLYLVHRSCSSGWATWADRWNGIDWEVSDAEAFFLSEKKMKRFDRGGEGMSRMLNDQLHGRIDAWDIIWDYHIYKHDGYCIRPIKSFCVNIGFDGSGTHCVPEEPLPSAPLYNPARDTLRLEPHLRPNREVQRIFYNYWSDTPKLSLSTQLKRGIKKLLRQLGLMKQPQ